MMIRREAIESVGGFDLGFTKYFEDVDISLRMLLAGWNVMYNGQAHCFHHEQRTSARRILRDAWRHCLLLRSLVAKVVSRGAVI